MEGALDETLESVAAGAAVLRVYRQVFAVLAREAGAMIGDAESIEVDEAILEAFAEAGSEGLTIAQAVAACPRFEAREVERRFGVLRDYGALSKVVERSNELYYRAAFAPYVMLLFLRRIAAQGGQSELHQLLTLEDLGVRSPTATLEDGRASAVRLTKVFRLIANELAILAARSSVETLRENAQLLWGNRSLVPQGEEVHEFVLGRWPQLHRECAALRIAVAAYGDAIERAAGRLAVQAGTTRALGMLPVETWRTFADESDAASLAAVLDGFLFDAPSAWFTPQLLAEAVESARVVAPTRLSPPRPEADPPQPEEAVVAVDDAQELRAIAERLLGDRTQITVAELLDRAGDWASGRRVLAEVTAIHQHADLQFEVVWGDRLRVSADAPVSFVSLGVLRRTDPAGAR